MQIAKNKVASIHYTLKDNEGNILDTSGGRDPLLYIHGVGNLIPGMEEGLEGQEQGTKLELKIKPEKGYGVRNDELIQKVPRSAFGSEKVEQGMQFQTGNGGVVTVTNVGLNEVTIDGNHALAGVDLNFSIEVMEVRTATVDEIAHGHVHGPGGHH